MFPLQILPESTLVLVLVFGAVAAGLGLLAAATYAEHRREMALIETGQYDADRQRNDSRAWVLGAGLLLVGIGVGQLVDGLAVGATGLPGAVPASVGLAALAYYFVRRREDRRDRAGGRPNTE